MNTIHDSARLGFRCGLLLWLAGMAGVVAFTITALPRMLADVSLPAPLWTISLVTLAQSGLLLAIAVWAGVVLAPKVALHAPAFEAAVDGRDLAGALRPQILPGFLAGLSGGVLLVVAIRYSPLAITEAEEAFTLPLIARVLYGGITEEILLRWGLMTFLVWLAWRFLQKRAGLPKAGYVWLAIALSAILFGIGHLPAASATHGVLDAGLIVSVVGANAVFGLVFGYLFWKWGLESAIIAHALSHVVSYSIASLPT